MASLTPCTSEWNKICCLPKKTSLGTRLLGGSITMVTRSRKYRRKYKLMIETRGWDSVDSVLGCILSSSKGVCILLQPSRFPVFWSLAIFFFPINIQVMVLLYEIDPATLACAYVLDTGKSCSLAHSLCFLARKAEAQGVCLTRVSKWRCQPLADSGPCFSFSLSDLLFLLGATQIPDTFFVFDPSNILFARAIPSLRKRHCNHFVSLQSL